MASTGRLKLRHRAETKLVYSSKSHGISTTTKVDEKGEKLTHKDRDSIQVIPSSLIKPRSSRLSDSAGWVEVGVTSAHPGEHAKGLGKDVTGRVGEWPFGRDW